MSKTSWGQEVRIMTEGMLLFILFCSFFFLVVFFFGLNFRNQTTMHMNIDVKYFYNYFVFHHDLACYYYNCSIAKTYIPSTL
jgi:uncharacterized membrane protein